MEVIAGARLLAEGLLGQGHSGVAAEGGWAVGGGFAHWQGFHLEIGAPLWRDWKATTENTKRRVQVGSRVSLIRKTRRCVESKPQSHP